MQVMLFTHFGVGRQNPRGPRLTPSAVPHRGQGGRPVRRQRPWDGRVRVAVGRDGVRSARQAVQVPSAAVGRRNLKASYSGESRFFIY